jgi:hypothetical protein
MKARAAVRCPICRKDVARDAGAFPFCSERCRLVDLGNWLGERYVIADDAEEPSGADDEAH